MKRVVVQKLPKGAIIEGPVGPKGPKGDPGVGTPGPKGERGEPGTPGISAPIPAEIINEVGKIPKILNHLDKVDKRIQEIEKKPTQQFIGGSSGGVTEVVRYVAQEDADHVYATSDFITGINIIGVRYVGSATVQLPHDLEVEKIVTVKDEAGLGDVLVVSY